MWLIWSVEHRAWWKSNSYGYTESREEAGRYDYDTACQIVKDSNYYSKDEPYDTMVPEVNNYGT
jgi:hypothetical protein